MSALLIATETGREPSVVGESPPSVEVEEPTIPQVQFILFHLSFAYILT